MQAKPCADDEDDSRADYGDGEHGKDGVDDEDDKLDDIPKKSGSVLITNVSFSPPLILLHLVFNII